MNFISNKAKLLVGLFFLLFDLNLNMGTINFNMFPTFIGFFLISLAIQPIEKKSSYFVSLRKYSFLMSYVFVVIYLINMFGALDALYGMAVKGHTDDTAYMSRMAMIFNSIQLVLNAALIFMVVYAMYLLVNGYKEITEKQGMDIERYGKQFFNTFQIFAVIKILYIAAYAMLIYIPNTLDIIMAVFSAASMIASVVLIIQAHKSYAFISD